MHTNTGLLRVLGIGFALAVVVGGAVGQGIMRTPGIVAGAVQWPALILLVWLAGGLIAAIDAFALSELAASHPCSGGPYGFARRALGPMAGVLTAWADYIQGTLGIAFVTIVFGEYLHRLGLLSDIPVAVLAAALILACGIINWTGTRFSGSTQLIGTVTKAALLLLLVALLFLAPRDPSPAPVAPLDGAVGLAGVIIALRAATVTYSGWHGATYFCEEVRHPERTVARALFGGLALITALYVLVNAALLSAMTPAEIAASNLPAADALARAYGPATGLLTTVIALVSVMAISNLQVMGYTRVMHAMARDGAMPHVLDGVHGRGTPRMSLLVTVTVSMILAASGSYETLIAASTVMGQLVFLTIDFAAIRLRLAEPDLPRPYRMPLFPLPAVLGIIVNIALVSALVWEDPASSLIGVVMLAIIAAGYGIAHLLRKGGPHTA